MRTGSSRLLVLAILAAAALAIVVPGHQQPSSSTSTATSPAVVAHLQPCDWPPSPPAMVVIDSTGHPQADADGGVQLPMDAVVPIYAVPSGRWLVLTDFPAFSAQLLKVVGVNATVMVDTDLTHFTCRTGVAFPPGSTVALRSTSSPSGAKSYYHFTGYLAPGGAATTCDWPPSPESMVVLNSRESPGAWLGYLPVPANSTISIYTVPLDKWLVITDPDVRGGGIRLVELNGTTTTVKAREAQYIMGHPPTVGLAFAPGTQLGIQNVGASTQNFCQYLMTGYLAAK